MAAVLLCVLPCNAYGLEYEPPSSLPDRIYVFKADEDYPPHQYRQGDQATGFDVELLRAAARVMNIKVRVEPDSWETIRHELEAGKIDGAAGVFFSHARGELFDFSIPHSLVGHSLFVRENSSIRELDGLRGKSVMVIQGDIMHDFLLERDLGITIDPRSNARSVLRALASGEGDAALLQRVMGLYLVKQMRSKNLKEAPVAIFSLPICFAVSKGNTALLEKFIT